MQTLKMMKTLSRSKIIKIHEHGAARLASELLRSGQVIALPTDTIYGNLIAKRFSESETFLLMP